jgi:hypothetical protein
MAFGRPTHYYQDARGERIPGVTTLLGEGLPKPALINWAGNATASYAVDNWEDLTHLSVSERLDKLKKCRYEERDTAAKRGTEVHALAEHLVKGESVTVPDELRGHVEAYVKFLDDWEPEPLLVEVTVVNYSVGYAGTLDAVYTLPDGTVVLSDIKTTRSGIYGDVALQLAAYRFAEVYLDADGKEQPMPPVDECHAVWVRSDGYSVIPLKCDAATFDDFRRVMQVARLMPRLPSLKGEELQAVKV